MNYLKYLISKPLLLIYVILVVLFCSGAIAIIFTQLSDGVEIIFLTFLILLIFVVAQLQPIFEYYDKH